MNSIFKNRLIKVYELKEAVPDFETASFFYLRLEIDFLEP